MDSAGYAFTHRLLLSSGQGFASSTSLRTQMKTNLDIPRSLFDVLFKRLFACGLIAGSALVANAQSVATVPIGSFTFNIPAASAGSLTITTLTPVLRLNVSTSFVGKTRGTLTAVSSSVLSDSQAGWALGALSQAATPYFIKIRSGAASGAMWQVSTSIANTATDASILAIHGIDPAIAGVQVGDSYEIIPADTLGSFFSSIEVANGGASASVADVVRIHNGIQWNDYYYNTTKSIWTQSGFDNTNTVLRPNSGIIYIHRGTTAIALTLTGTVCDLAERYAVPASGATFIAGAYPVDRQLSSLGIELMPGFVPNTGTLAVADKVRVFNGLTWSVYNFNSVVAKWTDGPFSLTPFDRNTTIIKAGTPIIIERGNGAAGSSVLCGSSLPYTL